MGVNDGTSATRSRMLRAAEISNSDARLRAPGLRAGPANRWAEGNAPAPLGWEPWDYEQGKGYTGYLVGLGESPRSTEDEWDFEEVGVRPWDLTDEMEDWDLAPFRRSYSRDWDFEHHRRAPEVDPKKWVKPKNDDLARRYERQQMKNAERAALSRAQQEQAEKVQADRRAAAEQKDHLRELERQKVALRLAARKQIEAKARSGEEGRFAVQVRKGNRLYRVDYRVEDGTAYVLKRKYAWAPLEDRR